VQITQSPLGVEGLQRKLEVRRNHYFSQSTSRHCTFSVEITQSPLGVEGLQRKLEVCRNHYFSQSTSRHCTFSVEITQSPFGRYGSPKDSRDSKISIFHKVPDTTVLLVWKSHRVLLVLRISKRLKRLKISIF
jgi:hypothetical protein